MVMSTGISWFPPGWEAPFYVVKGLVSLLATLLLIVHMSRTWDSTTGRGQRLRYLTLLYFAVLLTAASVEQSEQGADVDYRNLGGLGGAVLLVVTMVVSLAEYFRRNRKP